MDSAVTPLYVRLLSGLVKPFPDFDFGFIKPVRSRAVALLQLGPGAQVLDVGCGSGGSFPYLVQAVGSRGRIVGVELSSSSAAHATRRAAKNDWRNVEVLVSAAETVALTGSFDGLLMFAAPDVFASEASLDRLFPSLTKGARVAFFGGKKSMRRFSWLLNGLLNFAVTRLSLPTSPGLETQPWGRISTRVSDLEVREYFYGWSSLRAALSAATLDPSTSNVNCQMRAYVVAATLLAFSSLASAEIRRPGCGDEKVLAPDKRRNGGVSASTPALDRYYALSQQMRSVFKGSSPQSARPIAEAYLSAASDFPCNRDYGNAIHDGNVVSGSLALQDGKQAEAAAYLRAAGSSPGSPQLDSFGPSLVLARDLARAGEFDAVADYLSSIKRFWKARDGSLLGMTLPVFTDPDPIQTWIAQARKGREPSFNPMNLHAP